MTEVRFEFGVLVFRESLGFPMKILFILASNVDIEKVNSNNPR